VKYGKYIQIQCAIRCLLNTVPN